MNSVLCTHVVISLQAAQIRQVELGKMKKHKIIKSGGRCAADLFHHFVRHHFAILVLGSLGCGCPALGESGMIEERSNLLQNRLYTPCGFE